MSTELQSTIPAAGRNHQDAPCPKCGGRLTNREAGNIPGAVACTDCGWQGEHRRTESPWDMETGGTVAWFYASSPGRCAECRKAKQQSKPVPRHQKSNL